MKTIILCSALLGVTVLSLGGCQSTPSGQELATAVAEQDAKVAEAFPRVELRLNPAHEVSRSMVQNDNGQLLQWVVIYNGDIVTERNARKEMRFRHHRQDRGVYTVYMQQYIGGAYRVISNVVSYRID